MKIKVALVGLLFAASLLQAQTPPAVPAPTSAAPKAPATKAAPAKTPATKAVKPKEEVLPKIPGTEIPRPNGMFLGLEVVDGNFKLTFYDKKKKPMAVDVTRATARWPNPRSPGDNRTVLNGSGTALIGAKPVRPPFIFNVYLTLLKGEGDEAKAVENYTVGFRG